MSRVALVIGGSDMLAGVVYHLAESHQRVTVVARTQQSLDRLVRAAPPQRGDRLGTVAVEYGTCRNSYVESD
jgi:glutamyl-tRNA reductase